MTEIMLGVIAVILALNGFALSVAIQRVIDAIQRVIDAIEELGRTEG